MGAKMLIQKSKLMRNICGVHVPFALLSVANFDFVCEETER